LPSEDEKKEKTVSFSFVETHFFFYICIYEMLGSDWSCIRESIGGGIGSISNILDASQMTLKISVSLLLHLSFLIANFILVAIHCSDYGNLIPYNETDAIPYVILSCCHALVDLQ